MSDLDPLRTVGLMTVLRDSGVASALATSLDAAAPPCPATHARQLVAIIDEKADPLRCSQSLDPSAGIVVLARDPTRPYGLVLSAAGISCVDSEMSVEDILAAVRLAAKGGCVFLSGAGSCDVRSERNTERILTSREIQVLTMLSVDMSYAAIALKLGISAETAKKHTRHLLQKLSASSKRELSGLPVQWLNRRRAVEHGDDLTQRKSTLPIDNCSWCQR